MFQGGRGGSNPFARTNQGTSTGPASGATGGRGRGNGGNGGRPGRGGGTGNPFAVQNQGSGFVANSQQVRQQQHQQQSKGPQGGGKTNFNPFAAGVVNNGHGTGNSSMGIATENNWNQAQVGQQQRPPISSGGGGNPFFVGNSGSSGFGMDTNQQQNQLGASQFQQQQQQQQYFGGQQASGFGRQQGMQQPSQQNKGNFNSNPFAAGSSLSMSVTSSIFSGTQSNNANNYTNTNNSGGLFNQVQKQGSQQQFSQFGGGSGAAAAPVRAEVNQQAIRAVNVSAALAPSHAEELDLDLGTDVALPSAPPSAPLAAGAAAGACVGTGVPALPGPVSTSATGDNGAPAHHGAPAADKQSQLLKKYQAILSSSPLLTGAGAGLEETAPAEDVYALMAVAPNAGSVCVGASSKQMQGFGGGGFGSSSGSGGNQATPSYAFVVGRIPPFPPAAPSAQRQ
jgi:hypothetical protein